jgi:hypothetical protein
MQRHSRMMKLRQGLSGEVSRECITVDCRLVPAVGPVLAVGRADTRAVAVCVAVVAAVSLGWHHVRRRVRVASGNPVPAGPNPRVPR